MMKEFLSMSLRRGFPTTAMSKEILDLKPQGNYVSLRGSLFEEGKSKEGNCH